MTRAVLHVVWLVLRRSALENSALALTALVAAGGLVAVAGRVTTARALDLWCAGAVLLAVSLPVGVPGPSPLTSVRVALLPISPVALRRARVVAGSPLRTVLALAVFAGGLVAAHGLAGGPALVALAGWAAGALVAGDWLDDRVRSAGGGAPWWRGLSVASIAAAGWCLWRVQRGLAPAGAAEGTLLPVLPPLLPRTAGATDWLAAWLGGGVVAAAIAGHLAGRPAAGARASAPAAHAGLRSARRGHAAAMARPTAATRRWTPGVSATALRRLTPRLTARLTPRLRREALLLGRHGGPRVALLGVALLACAATYGRVPGLALGAALPFAMLTSNLLGADVALGGIVRGALLPEPPAALRDRRLAVWTLATGLAASVGAAVGLTLPAPSSVGQPPAGALAAPAALVYAAALVPWFGRASWWWAVRYPQPAWRATRNPGGAPAGECPAGPAHLQLALLGCWAAVASAAALLWAITAAIATAVVHHGPAARVADPRARSAGAWIGGVLLAAGLAAGAAAWRATRSHPGPNRT